MIHHTFKFCLFLHLNALLLVDLYKNRKKEIDQVLQMLEFASLKFFFQDFLQQFVSRFINTQFNIDYKMVEAVNPKKSS